MEKTINDFSIGLMIWQILALVSVVLVFFLLLRIYRKLSKYLDLKIKLLEKKIASGED
jgi:hypothetical protein